MTTASLYARVSTEEQTEGYSIDAQKRAFHALCEGRGWTIHNEYIEAGKSAHTDDMRKRPVFKEAMEDALAGKYDVIVVHKIDRFSRKLRITLEYFEKLGKAGIGFVAIENQIDYSTPEGKLMLTLQGGLAEFYSDNLSRETKKGWAERKAQGLYCGLLPFGVMKGENGIPVPDPNTHPGLIMAFNLADQGKTYREAAKALNDQNYHTAGNMGNGPFTKDSVAGILRNRFYVGELPDGNGGWIKAKHEPLVNKELFDRVQKQIAHRRRYKNRSVRSKAQTFSLSGLMKCNICQSRITVHQTKDGRPRTYCRGRAYGAECDCKGTFLDVYEAQIQWYLSTFIIPNDYRERILEAHRRLEDAYDDIEKRRSLLEKRLQRLQEQYEWGHINKGQYLDKHSEIRRELANLAPQRIDNGTLEQLSRFLRSIPDAWEAATHEQRNKLANTLFEEIKVEHNRVVGVKPKDEFRPFFQLSYEDHTKSSTYCPDPHRGRHCNIPFDRPSY